MVSVTVKMQRLSCYLGGYSRFPHGDLSVSLETACPSLAVTHGGISLGSRDPEGLRDFLVDEELGKTDLPWQSL